MVWLAEVAAGVREPVPEKLEEYKSYIRSARQFMRGLYL